MSLKLIKIALIFFISLVVSTESNQENGPPKFMHEITKLNEKILFLSTNIDELNNCNCCCSSENQSKAENEELKQTKLELKAMKTKLSDLEEQITKKVNETLRDFINNYQKSANEKSINRYEEGPATLYNLSSKSLVYTWKLQINESDEYESQVFPLAKYGMNGQVKLVITQPNSCQIYFRFKRLHPAAIFTLKTHPRVTYVLRDESENEERKDVVLAHDFIPYGIALGFDKYEYSMSIDYFDQEIYIKDGWMTIEVHVSSPEEDKLVQSSDGVLKGTIANYHQLTKWSGRMWRVFSPYFRFGGCRAVVGIRLHDLTSGDDWLDVAIYLLTGEDDHPDLVKSYDLRMAFTVVNQVDSTKNLYQFEDVDDVTRVYFKFKVPENLSEFIMNDKIVYQATLESSHSFPDLPFKSLLFDFDIGFDSKGEDIFAKK